MSEQESAPLHGVRVVSAAGDVAGGYVGRLLADLGADVIALEPPAGHEFRRRPPYVGGIEDSGRSAFAAYFLAGLRSVAVDQTDDGDRARLARILGAADVAIRTAAVPDDDQIAAAERSNPGLIVVDVSTFGRTGPLASTPGGDLMAHAASGMLSVVASNPQDGPVVPIRLRGELTSVFAACHATIATLGALHARLADGLGQRLDVSALEAMVGTMATALPSVTYAGLVPVAGGNRGVCPWAIYTCRDGSFLVQCTEDGQWRALVELLGDPEWGQLELFETTTGRIEQEDVINAFVGAAVADFTVDEFLAAAHDRGVPACRLHSPADVLAWEQLAVRRSFRQLDLDGQPVTVPASPIRIRGVDAPAAPVVPAVGADTATLDWDPRPPTVGASRPPAETAAPLAGLRVIDMTWVWAGPFSTMQLAHLGADVIKVESHERIDVTRRLGPFVDEVPGIDRSGYFNQFNQGKRSICLDPRTPEGEQVLARLIASADVIVDNMRAGALERMGFDDDRLRRLNPRIVAVSMTGYGETGPERDKLAYGSLIDALAGITAITGPVGGGPTEIPMSLPDPNAGLHAAIGALAGSYRARTTGVGADLECSMLEAWLGALPWGVVTMAAEGRPPAKQGTRDDVMCPHGAFPCAGDFAWVAIAVADDAEFAALAAAIGEPTLAVDERFASVAARRAHEDELERIIGAWTASRDRDEVACRLTAVGVRASAARTIDEVAACDHLWARNFFTTLEHPEAGRRPLAGPPWHASRSPMRPTTAAPTLGQHTAEVMGELGLDPAEVADLVTRGIIG